MSITIITCVNQPAIYEECLLASANACRHKHDIAYLPVLNVDNQYSASSALNFALRASKSDINVIVHQDVKLLGNWFDTLNKQIKKLPDNWAILGTAGIDAKYKRKDTGPWGGSVLKEKLIVGTVYGSDDPTEAYWDGTKEPRQVHCVDECLFVLRKSKMLEFDYRYNGFHFYGVDICLQARSAGCGVYACSLPIIHYGKYSGSMAGNSRYWPFLHRTYVKWRTQFPEVLGTHFHWAKDELTSYISTELSSDDGTSITVKAANMSKFQTITKAST